MRPFLLTLLLLCASITANGKDVYTQSDIGAGGWLMSGAFHPTNGDILLLGTDVTGGIFRTDDGGLTWRPFNLGLQNTSEMDSMYVEDIIGVVEPEGAVAFYAATHAGIYRRAETDDAWDWMADDQRGQDTMIHWHNSDSNRTPISFSCIDWNGDNLLVAGAGRVRWKSNYENDYYPNIPATELRDEPHNDHSYFDTNTELCSLWVYDFDNTSREWTALVAPPDLDDGSGLGTVRDISVAKIFGQNYILAATTKGIYMHNYETGAWEDLSNNYFIDMINGAAVESLNYRTHLTAWSIHVTQRGTIYAAMQGINNENASGVYRILNGANSPTGVWTWVGSGQNILPQSKTMWELGQTPAIGTDPGNAAFIYLSVVDGIGDDPDILYLGDRQKTHGFFRGSQPDSYYDEGGAFSPLNATWTSLVCIHSGTLYPSDFQLGWVERKYGIQILFHPIVFPADPTRIAAQFNCRVHISNNSGDQWEQIYTNQDGNAWQSRGYNEHCIRGITHMSDGRTVFGVGDMGTFISSDNTASSYSLLLPEISSSSEPKDNKLIWSNSDSMHVRPNWRGDGRDALFINFSDTVSPNRYGKLFFYREPELPGGQPEWFNITATLEEYLGSDDKLEKYIFGEFTFSNDETCFLTYIKYESVINGPRAEYGVLRGVFVTEDPVMKWRWEKVNDGLPDRKLEIVKPNCTDILCHNHIEQRIFLTIRRVGELPPNGQGGGLYMLPSPWAPTWQTVHDPDNPNIFDDVRDFHCLAQSQDGTRLYAGTRGRSGAGIGTVLKCNDPTAPMVSSNWEIMANSEGYFPFGFSDERPFWIDDRGWSDQVLEERFTHVSSIAVDPDNVNDIYITLLCEKGFMKQEGLWRYRSDLTDWFHQSLDEDFYGMGMRDVEFNPYVPGQMFFGTTGQGLYFNSVQPDPIDPPPPPPNNK